MRSTLLGYDSFEHRHVLCSGHEAAHPVYSKGSGPPVLLIQELPGIGRETMRLADELLAEGFSVYLPHLFGPLGVTRTLSNLARVFCLRRELSLFQRGRSSPIVDWLRALTHVISQRSDGRPVGVIGMCLTGNFAISLLTEPCVRAAVAAQPSLPVLAQRDLHMSQEELQLVRGRLEKLEPALLYHFEGDPLCTAQKARAYEAALNDPAQQRINTRSLPGRGHSVFTIDFVNEEGHPTRRALDEVLDYLKRTLLPAGAS